VDEISSIYSYNYGLFISVGIHGACADHRIPRRETASAQATSNSASDAGSGTVTLAQSSPTRSSSNWTFGAPTVFTFRKLKLINDANASAMLAPGELVSIAGGGDGSPNVGLARGF